MAFPLCPPHIYPQFFVQVVVSRVCLASYSIQGNHNPFRRESYQPYENAGFGSPDTVMAIIVPTEPNNGLLKNNRIYTSFPQ